MVELFPTRRRAEALARALDGDTQATDARLQELLDTATRLAAVPLVQPRARFRDSLRERLVEAAATELPAQAAERAESQGHREAGRTGAGGSHAARGRRRLVAAATGLVLVGGGTGVGAASEQALPGDVLYPVKRTIEAAQVALTSGPDAKGRALLSRAANRLDEAAALSAGVVVGDAGVDAVEAALADFAADAGGGGELLLGSYAADGDPAHLRTLRAFTGDSHEVLAGLAGMLPPQAQAELTAADTTVVRLDDLARRACPDCTLPPPLVGLPTEPISLPALGGEAFPGVPGTRYPDVSGTRHRDVPGTPAPHGSRADDADPRPAKGRHANHSPPRPSTVGSGGQGTTAPALPDLRLDELGRQPRSRQHDAVSGGGSDDRAQQGPRLEVGDVLQPAPAPTPAQPRRATDAPLPRHVESLAEPLPPPLDRSRDTPRRLDELP